MSSPNNNCGPTDSANLDAVTHYPPPGAVNADAIYAMEGPLDHLELQGNVQRTLGRVFKGLKAYNLEGLQFLEEMREILCPSMLCHQDVVICYDIFKAIRIFMEERNVSCVPTPESGRMIARRVICAVWPGDEFAQERKQALTLFEQNRNGSYVANNYISSPTANAPISFATASPAVQSTPSETREDQFENKIANAIATRYRSKYSLFSGAIDEDWSQFAIRYVRICNEQRAKAMHRVEYLHYALRDHALAFYHRNIVDKNIDNWGIVMRVFNEAFCSPEKMQNMTDQLEAMNLEKFEASGLDESKALEKLMREIERISPMALPTDRGESNMKRTLQRATAERQFALFVTSSPGYQDLSYIQTKTAFARAQQRFSIYSKSSRTKTSYERISSRPNRWTNSESLISVNAPDHTAEFDELFTGQGRLHSSTSPSSTYTRNSQPHRNTNGPSGPCFNCEKPNCSLRHCKYPLNFQRIAKNKAEFFKQKKLATSANLSEALFEFAQELHSAIEAHNQEDDTATLKEDANESNYTHVYQTLLANSARAAENYSNVSTTTQPSLSNALPSSSDDESEGSF